MCIGEAFLFILNLDRNQRKRIDDAMIELGKTWYKSMGKNYTQTISRDEFVAWIKTNYFDKGIVTVDTFFSSMVPEQEAMATVEA